MPNDVAADEKGDLYITDSQRNLIYHLSGGTMEEWLISGDLPKPNGICIDRGRMLIGTSGDGCIKTVNPENKSVSTLACLGEGAIMDGISADGNYLISDCNGRLFKIDRKSRAGSHDPLKYADSENKNLPHGAQRRHCQTVLLLQDMNKPLVLFLLLLLAAPAGQLMAQKGSWSAGIEGGPGLSLIYGKESVYSHSAPALAGAAGIFGEYGFASRFSARAALHYERISTTIDNHSAILPSGGRLKYNLDYLSLPLLVKWTSRGKLRFFADAGPCVSLLLQESLWHLPGDGSKQKAADETAAFQRVNLAVTAGVGVAMPVGKKFLVSLEVRDNFGVLNIRSATSGFEQISYLSAGATKGHTNSALLLAGVAWRFGGNKGMPCTPNDPDFQYLGR